MKKLLLFLAIGIQSIFICCFMAVASLWLREGGFDHVIRLGWPKVFFTAFDAGNSTLNHGANVGNFLTDLIVSVCISVPFIFLLKHLFKRREII